MAPTPKSEFRTISEPITGAVAITASDTDLVPKGRQFAVVCSAPGNVKVGFSDASVLTIPVTVGLTILPWEVTQVFTTGTTATATFLNLK